MTKQENDNSNSKPELQIKFKNIVRQLDIFSEGRLVEVFGEHNEYLFTCESDFVDDWEGMAVYHTKIILPGLLLCKLKVKEYLLLNYNNI